MSKKILNSKAPLQNSLASNLLGNAHQTGSISSATLATLDIVDVGAQIQAGLGVSVDDIAASEVVLLTMMADDSSSIASAGNADAVRLGHNHVIDALKASKQSGEVLAHTCYLNGDVLFPYATLDNAVAMTTANYDPRLGTPLYDQTVVVLGTVLAKAAELAAAGIAVRTVTLLITDGGDCGSRRCKASDVKRIVSEMLAQESHTVAAMGISDGSTDFRAVFRQMGIPDRWILTPGNSPSEVRRAFTVFSQSAARASGGGGFALAGFGN
jgi:hypothetical protein